MRSLHNCGARKYGGKTLKSEVKMSTQYLPFRGLSAWFSSSVKPCMAKKWDEFGGCLASEDKADFLFSNSSYSVDTVRVYDTQLKVTVFKPEWLCEVIKRHCTVHDIPLGQYLVLPDYLIQMYVRGDPFMTPEPSVLMADHRRRENGQRGGGGGGGGGGEGDGSFTKLLAKREERKESKLGHIKNRKKEVLKNSREFYPSSWPGSKRETSNCSSAQKKNSMSEMRGGSSSMVVWGSLIECMKTSKISDFQHLNSMELLDYMVIDFDPTLAHFTMRRK